VNAALTPFRVEAALWLILWLGLATGIGLVTDWGRQMRLPMTEIDQTPPEFRRPVLAEPFSLSPPDQFLDITMRPLFIVTRRPAPTPPPPEPPKPGMVKGQFILMGTTVVGKDKFAFMLEKAGNKSRVVAEGKEINGIMVKEVTTERVVLSQYDDTEVLVLRTNKPPPGASATRGVAPGAPVGGGVVPGANPPPRPALPARRPALPSPWPPKP
jgi:hypothetical protein